VSVGRRIFRTLSRTREVWADEGFAGVLRQLGVKFGLLLRGKRFLVEGRSRPSIEDQYQIWIDRQEASPRREVEQAIAGYSQAPLVSVLTVVDAGDAASVSALLKTLQDQAYKRWELCFAMRPGTREVLKDALETMLASESRLRMEVCAGDSPTLADAYRVSGGEFIAFIEAGDALAPDALFELVNRLQQDPAADLVYSDEDAMTADGRRENPLFKPEWSPDLLLSMNYVACAGLLRKSLVDEVGGFATELGPGQLYDLVLRLTEKTSRIAHVPKVLYHRRTRPATLAASQRLAMHEESCALAAALARRRRRGHVTTMSTQQGPRCYATRFELREAPLVSIIIPTRNNRKLLQNAIESISRHTGYKRYEILVVDNGSTEPGAVEYLASPPAGCQVLRWNDQFNYSAINNMAVRHAQGEQLLFLNDDVEVISPDWLTAMLEHAERPEVGAVGARLLYQDGRIQHAGVVVGINQGAANAFRRRSGDAASPRLAELVREVSAVTGACMMVRRQVFDQVGGFDETLPVIFNDVDLCLRIRDSGYVVLYTPHAQLYHYEGSTRGRRDPQRDREVFQERWAHLLARTDPYYNANLTDRHDDWSLRIDD
jgi:GT2 family glycosyltransferase